MKAKVIVSMAPICKLLICPTVYETDRGTYVMQGKKLNPEEKSLFNVPQEEDVVELPAELISQFVQKFSKA